MDQAALAELLVVVDEPVEEPAPEPPDEEEDDDGEDSEPEELAGEPDDAPARESVR